MKTNELEHGKVRRVGEEVDLAEPWGSSISQASGAKGLGCSVNLGKDWASRHWMW